jgi:hypothetical protein
MPDPVTMQPQDPAGAVDPQPVQTDPSGQAGPAPDTVGVPDGQFAVTAPNQGEPTADAPARFGSGDVATTTETSSLEITPADPAPSDQPDESAPEEVPTVSLVDDPDAEAVSAPATEAREATEDAPAVEAKPERVLVSPSDPVLGTAVSRWLEAQAARDARLGPLVERLQFLPNAYLAFPADDPMFQVPAPEPQAA